METQRNKATTSIVKILFVFPNFRENVVMLIVEAENDVVAAIGSRLLALSAVLRMKLII